MLLVHILEVLGLILDVGTDYLGTFRVPYQYIKASAATVPQITLQQLLSILHKILTTDAIRL